MVAYMGAYFEAVLFPIDKWGLLISGAILFVCLAIYLSSPNRTLDNADDDGVHSPEDSSDKGEEKEPLNNPHISGEKGEIHHH